MPTTHLPASRRNDDIPTAIAAGIEAFVTGWLAARTFYGRTESETGLVHGAECVGVAMPAVSCLCDAEEAEREARAAVTALFGLTTATPPTTATPAPTDEETPRS